MNRATLSRVKSTLYRKPREELSKLSRWGVRAYFHCDSWAREMEAAAAGLPCPEVDPSLRPIETWFLTGERFWFQTAFCAWTLSVQSRREVVVHLVDDGSLRPSDEQSLRRLFPKGSVTRTRDTEARLEESLPRERYPVLRRRCDDYVNIRKLVDVHLASAGWKLVLDSDMLFFDSPDEILSWWDGAVRSPDDSPILLMRDCEESYGYSRELMTRLTGAAIPPLLNVGVCGLRSEEIDWNEIETWCRVLSETEGTSYFLEQALVAMMASARGHNVLPRAFYTTFPSESATREGSGVLQHYVSDSKPWYFGHAWRIARDRGRNLAPVELVS